MIFGGFEFCGVFGGLDLFGGLVVWWFAEFLVAGIGAAHLLGWVPWIWMWWFMISFGCTWWFLGLLVWVVWWF